VTQIPPSACDWAERIAAARSAIDRSDAASLDAARDVARDAHAALELADADGRAADAFLIAEALDAAALDVFKDDPQSLHAIWNDFGTLLYERGAREKAASVLRSALEAYDAWIKTDQRPEAVENKRSQCSVR
jgi:hypothetical protein